jgi:hypothetical protein
MKSMEDWDRGAFNRDIHEHLVALGYRFTPQIACFGYGDEWEDAVDRYEGPEEYIVIDEGGHVVSRWDRDLDQEAREEIWLAMLEGSFIGPIQSTSTEMD